MSNIEPIYEYDSNGNCIHYRDSKGYEKWWEYDTNGNLIHFRNSKGDEYWQEYDTNGNWIHYRNSIGFESWREYDTNGNLIHCRDSNGDEEWLEYDSNGNLIHRKDTNGYEQWWEYDTKGNMIHYQNSNGDKYWYDTDGNVIDKPTEKKDNTTMALTAKETIGLKWSSIKGVDWEGNTPIVQHTYDKKDLIVTGIISHEYENDDTMYDYIPVIIEEWTDDDGYHFSLNPITLGDGMMHDAWINRKVLINQYEYQHTDFWNDILNNSAISPVFVGESGRLYGLYDMMSYYDDQIESLKKKIAKLEGNNNGK